MQIASCLLVYNEFKSSVVKEGVTPAEVQLLVLMHSDNAGECAVKNLKITGEDDRTSADEKKRLCGKYLAKHPDEKRVTVESIWPGHNSTLPERFDQVTDKEGVPVFTKDGQSVNAPKTESIVVGGKVFTKEQLEKLVASSVKVEETDLNEKEEDFEPKATSIGQKPATGTPPLVKK